MRKYFYIGSCGFLGAILRFLVESTHIFNYRGNIPINTFIINIFGSFSLALILTISLEVWKLEADIRLGITTGFLGAFTTFSTMCKETVSLMESGHNLLAVTYITVSAVIGLTAAYGGIVAARKLTKLLKRKSWRAGQN